ncbi:VanW family protein [Cohnella sp. JJ-181]|uniref:VanW family protein n=1 Tax=Cohnella rhizoplanae TaxID=2974897 RepID=UPI0022FF9817|nr:VanW family protein [Cohnella sp. JJ-181]CAI6084453.1 hypothetical protein COHCIP112018_04343 [Cohnella sp. JJ-181]
MGRRVVRVLAMAIALTLGLNAGWMAESGHAQTPGDGRAVHRTHRADNREAAAHHRSKEDRALPGGTVVGGFAVGGMGADEAIAAIRARIDRALAGRVALTDPLADAGGTDPRAPERDADGGDEDGGDPAKLRASAPAWRELGLMLDADEAIQAIARYRDAGWLGRRAARRALERSYPLAAAWDEETFAEKAEALWGERAEKKPVDAVRRIDARDRVVYSPESPGAALDVGALLAELKKRAPAGLSEDSGASPDAKDIPLRLSIPLPVVPVKAEITTASLQAEGIVRKIAEFSTSFASSGPGRVHNVTATADALDDTMLEPGDTFDYGAVVAEARRRFGYREAPVIVKGKLVPGIGGGICQVSSTLYNAVVRASNLAIVERRNHSLPVNYLPQGTDATFAEGYINFRFRNDTGKRLLIKTAVRGKRLTVKLFGTMPDNVRYELHTVRERETAPRIVYVKDAGIPVGMSRLVRPGKAGAVVDTYRLKYVDGKLADRRKLNRSAYRAQDGIVAVHPADPRAGGPQTPSPQGQSPAEPM